MDSFVLPSHFALVYYRFTLVALDKIHLPPYKGSVIRGGFGHTFKKLVCTYPRMCHKKCQVGNDCAYGYVFETAPPADAKALSLNNQIPRPYIIEAPRDRRELIIPGEQLSFGLTLVGYGMNLFPHFLAVFRELGWQGLGRTRGRYELLAIDAVSPYDGQVQAVYRQDNGQVAITDLVLTGNTFMAGAEQMCSDRVSLEFFTPVRIKHKGQIVRQGPSFQALVKSLLGRASSLSLFHCDQQLEVDFRGLIDQAAQVELTDSRTRWEKAVHYSGRQQKTLLQEGLVGRVTYQGNLQPYLPLLLLGELIQAGKGTVRGNGQYQIIPLEDN